LEEVILAEHAAEEVPSRRRNKNRPLPTSFIVLIFVLVAGVGYVAGTFHNQIISAMLPILGYKTYSGTLDLSSVQNVYQTLKANYDGELDDTALIEGASRGLVDAAGDEYTLFLNPSESDEFNNNLSGDIGGGVGIEIGLRNDVVTVLRVLKDNPAEQAGVRVGDIIVGVNDETNDDWSVQDAVTRIRGDVGTTVILTVLRGTETEEIPVTRDQVSNPSVYSSVSGDIGIMTITRFDNETGRLARQAAQRFIDNDISKVILDLRGNGGGYVTAAQEVAGIWLNNKVVVTERSNGRVVDELRSGTRPLLENIDTVVLVNESSASASEIVAGALQDYKAATLVGVETFGKGSVQKLIPLPGGAELKVTIARWFTPQGKNIGETGVVPGVSVTLTAEDINAGRDPQLDAAKAQLK